MKTKTSPFLLILRQPAGGAPAPQELQAIMAKFQVWMDGIRAKHEVLSSNGLVPTTGKVVQGPNLTETDGPYVEAKEVVGGYVLFMARNFEEATAAARACPGLGYGMRLEVREVMSRG
jgi:hypothetical protein